MNDVTAQQNATGWEKCQRLQTNPDVQWFIAVAVLKKVAEKQKELEDVATTKDAREAAAHVLAALKDVANFLKNQSDIYYRGIPKPKE